MMLQGKVAIITGAGQGVGQGIANVLAREGAKVAIVDLNGERAKIAADIIKAKGGEALAYAVDVLDMSRVKAMVEATLKAFGGLHILVNNAVAPSVNIPFAQSKEQDWDQDLGVGLKGYLVCTRAVINQFLSQNYGRIISISSSAGKMGSPNLAAYSAAKGAIIAFTKALARELAKTGVTVEQCCPRGGEYPHAGSPFRGIQSPHAIHHPRGPVFRPGGDRRDRGLPGVRPHRLCNRAGMERGRRKDDAVNTS